MAKTWNTRFLPSPESHPPRFYMPRKALYSGSKLWYYDFTHKMHGNFNTSCFVFLAQKGFWPPDSDQLFEVPNLTDFRSRYPDFDVESRCTMNFHLNFSCLHQNSPRFLSISHRSRAYHLYPRYSNCGTQTLMFHSKHTHAWVLFYLCFSYR